MTTTDDKNELEVLRGDVKTLSRGERKLRQLLFIRHGCNGPALYGDDGELQCKSCLIDFLRMLPDEIEQRFMELGLRKLVKLCETCGGYERVGDAVCPDCRGHDGAP